MNDAAHPHNLADLIDAIQIERTNLESLIAELTTSQKTAPGVVGNWSIKDIMAHIAAWERLAQDRIHAALTGESLKYPVISGDDFVDQYNLRIYQLNKEKPLSEIESDFHQSYQAFLEQINLLDDEILSSKLPFDWAGNLTVQIVISSNTHWHYAEHAESIEKWLDK